jgi:hypothetical protein
LTNHHQGISGINLKGFASMIIIYFFEEEEEEEEEKNKIKRL